MNINGENLTKREYVNTSVYFDGVNDSISYTTPISTLVGVTGDNGFAISFWLKIPSVTSLESRLLLYHGDGGVSDYLYILNNKNISSQSQTLYLRNVSERLRLSYVMNSSNSTLEERDEWLFHVYNIDNIDVNNSEIYVNSDNTYNVSVDLADNLVSLPTSDRIRTIGDVFFTGKLKGNLSQLVFWDRQLNKDEIVNLYNRGVGKLLTTNERNSTRLYFPLDDTISNSTVRDLSPNELNGTYNSGVLLNQNGPKLYDAIDSSVYFDGINDRIELATNIGDIVGVTGDSGFSITFWHRPSGVISSSNNTLFFMGLPGVNDALYLRNFHQSINNQYSMQLRDPSYNRRLEINYVNRLSDFKDWQFVSIVVDNVNPLNSRFLVNGRYDPLIVSGGSATVPLPSGNTERYIGYASALPFFLDGNLTSFACWEGQLTDEKIRQLYKRGFGSLLTDEEIAQTKLYLPLKETSGTTAFDYSPLKNNGIFQNGVKLNEKGIFGSLLNRSAYFDGINDRIDFLTPASVLYGTDGDSGYTISFWANYDLNDVDGTILYHGTTPPIFTDYHVIDTRGGSGSGDRKMTYIASNRITLIAQKVAPLANTWYFYTFVIDNLDLTLSKAYVNGIDSTLIDSTNQLNPVPNDDSTRWIGSPIIGKYISDFAIWGGKLTQEEILELYNDGNGRSLTLNQVKRTRLYFPMNEEAGTVVYDNSPNAINGIYVNGVSINKAGPTIY